MSRRIDLNRLIIVIVALIIILAGVVAYIFLGKNSNTSQAKVNVPLIPPRPGADASDLPPTGAADDPIIVPAADYIDVALPDLWQKEPFRVLRDLPDGRLVLQCQKKISIFDPATGEETRIAEADYGLQGAANDHYLAFGMGGDEVFFIDTYDFKTGELSRFMESDTGYFGIEIDEKNCFYTTTVTYSNMLKQPDSYISCNIDNGEMKQAGTTRSQPLARLLKLHPDIDTTWHYENGKPWNEAYQSWNGDLYAMTIGYEDTNKELMKYSLYQVDAKSGELRPLLEDELGESPVVHTGRDWISVNGRWFSEGNWHRCDRDNVHVLRLKDGSPDLMALVNEDGLCTGLMIKAPTSDR